MVSEEKEYPVYREIVLELLESLSLFGLDSKAAKIGQAIAGGEMFVLRCYGMRGVHTFKQLHGTGEQIAAEFCETAEAEDFEMLCPPLLMLGEVEMFRGKVFAHYLSRDKFSPEDWIAEHKEISEKADKMNCGIDSIREISSKVGVVSELRRLLRVALDLRDRSAFAKPHEQEFWREVEREVGQ